MRERSAALASVLAHVAALVAILVARPDGLPRKAVEVIEVSVVTEVEIAAPPSDSFAGAGPADASISPGAGIAYLGETLHAAGAQSAPPDWTTPNSALGNMRTIAKAAVRATARLEWNTSAQALDCLALRNGDSSIVSRDPTMPQMCKGKLVAALGWTRPVHRDKNYAATQPTSLFNIDWVPVLTDWDILLNQMLR
jgi:hypothetical protein